MQYEYDDDVFQFYYIFCKVGQLEITLLKDNNFPYMAISWAKFEKLLESKSFSRAVSFILKH